MDSNHPTKRFRPPSRLPPSPAGLLLMASRLGSLSCSLASDFSDGIFDVGDTLDLSTSCQLYWCPDWPSFLYPPPGYFRSFPDPPSFSQVLPDPPRYPLRPSQILPDPPDPPQILQGPPRYPRSSQIFSQIFSDPGPLRSSQVLLDPPRSSQIFSGPSVPHLSSPSLRSSSLRSVLQAVSFLPSWFPIRSSATPSFSPIPWGAPVPLPSAFVARMRLSSRF